MSCYEWESGTIILPKSEYHRIRLALIDAEEAFLALGRDVAKAALPELNRGAPAPWCGPPVHDVLEKHLGKSLSASPWVFDSAWANLVRSKEGVYSLKPKGQRRRRGALAYTFHDKDAGVHLRPESAGVTGVKCALTWDVEENNRACEHARAGWLGKAVFKALDGVTRWSRGTGGEIVGNDEYNRESRDDEGGANYSKDRWGPPDDRGAGKRSRRLRGQLTFSRWA